MAPRRPSAIVLVETVPGRFGRLSDVFVVRVMVQIGDHREELAGPFRPGVFFTRWGVRWAAHQLGRRTTVVWA